MKAYERLLNYVKILTPSNENSQTVPSSDCQFDLARVLENEMKELGLSDVYLDDKCYLYGKLPATKGYENCPAIGFIAHMDTVLIDNTFVGVSRTFRWQRNNVKQP